MAQLVAALPAFANQWPDDATLSLIRRRRVYQGLFASSRIRDQWQYWENISRDITTAHPNFAPTAQQSRNKWNSLKSGYENLTRLIAGNPNGFPTRTPTIHDETFYTELSDEFWLTLRNYLLINQLFI
jgi:hypothetical protein